MLIMEMSFKGLSNSSHFTPSIDEQISIPLVTLPNTVCLLSSQGVGTVVIKNCEPFVFGPALAYVCHDVNVNINDKRGRGGYQFSDFF